MLLFKDVFHEISSNLDFFSFKDSLNEATFKRFAELTIMFEHTRLCASLHCPEEEQIIRLFLIDQLNTLSPDRIFFNHYKSYLYILPYISVREFHQIEHLERCMEIVMGNKFFSTEIPPHRQMEHDYLLHKIGYLEEVKIPESSILRTNINVQHIDRNLTYAITHALFYLTDFGRVDNFQGIINPVKLDFLIGTLIAKAAENGDLDLLIELAINYFSLSNSCDIDYNLLYLINNVIQSTEFLEFQMTPNQLEEKYHTYLVLLIYLNRLETKLNSDQTISSKNKQIIKEFIDNGVPMKESRTIKFRQMEAWNIIKSLHNKNFDFTLAKKYYHKWGYCAHLSILINDYLNHLSERAQKDILWLREGEEMNLSIEQRLNLNNQLLEFLNLEKQILVR